MGPASLHPRSSRTHEAGLRVSRGFRIRGCWTAGHELLLRVRVGFKGAFACPLLNCIQAAQEISTLETLAMCRWWRATSKKSMRRIYRPMTSWSPASLASLSRLWVPSLPSMMSVGCSSVRSCEFWALQSPASSCWRMYLACCVAGGPWRRSWKSSPARATRSAWRPSMPDSSRPKRGSGSSSSVFGLTLLKRLHPGVLNCHGFLTCACARKTYWRPRRK